MDWETNSTDLLQFEKLRTPEIFLQSFELFTRASNHSTTTVYENTTFSITTELSSLIDTEEKNNTLRIYPALSLFSGELDEKYVERINAFWLQFNPPAAKTQFTIAIIYLILTVLGCFGNALVIFMFIRCKSLRTPANTLVINLVVSDFLMIAKSPIAAYNSYKLGPALGDLGCRIYGFIGGLSGCVSITTLTAIAIDRYHVIVYPLDPLRSTTNLRSRLTLLFVWFYSLIFASIPALDIGLSQYVPEGFLTTCSFDYLSKDDNERIFMFVFFIGAYLIPFIIITYCYFYILKVVASANSIQSSKDKNKTEIKLTAIVSGVILLWFFAWTPYAVVALLGISGNEHYITPLGSMIPAIFCKVSACINPYVYAVTHPRFRMEFGRIFLGQQIAVKRTSTFRSSTLSVRHNTGTGKHSINTRPNLQNLENNEITTLQNNNIELASGNINSRKNVATELINDNLSQLKNVEITSVTSTIEPTSSNTIF